MDKLCRDHEVAPKAIKLTPNARMPFGVNFITSPIIVFLYNLTLRFGIRI